MHRFETAAVTHTCADSKKDPYKNQLIKLNFLLISACSNTSLLWSFLWADHSSVTTNGLSSELEQQAYGTPHQPGSVHLSQLCSYSLCIPFLIFPKQMDLSVCKNVSKLYLQLQSLHPFSNLIFQTQRQVSSLLFQRQMQERLWPSKSWHQIDA